MNRLHQAGWCDWWKSRDVITRSEISTPVSIPSIKLCRDVITDMQDQIGRVLVLGHRTVDGEDKLKSNGHERPSYDNEWVKAVAMTK
ncbi:unnamed protein product [Peronospora belbahrii]|uniref:Uncharacterized protein n=1 Tax=Peronospora belbahrii TaxID=622444 RepID=A0ABN8D1I8_9STRA|nr:unnamed protein product [Peronospora belbahrii]